MNYTFASVLVTAQNQSLIQSLVLKETWTTDENGDEVLSQETIGTGYFNSPLSADGSAPATHFISTGPFDNQILDAVMASKLFDQVSFGIETNTFGLVPVQAEEPVTPEPTE